MPKNLTALLILDTFQISIRHILIGTQEVLRFDIQSYILFLSLISFGDFDSLNHHSVLSAQGERLVVEN